MVKLWRLLSMLLILTVNWLTEFWRALNSALLTGPTPPCAAGETILTPCAAGATTLGAFFSYGKCKLSSDGNY